MISLQSPAPREFTYCKCRPFSFLARPVLAVLYAAALESKYRPCSPIPDVGTYRGTAGPLLKLSNTRVEFRFLTPTGMVNSGVTVEVLPE